MRFWLSSAGIAGVPGLTARVRPGQTRGRRQPSGDNTGTRQKHGDAQDRQAGVEFPGEVAHVTMFGLPPDRNQFEPTKRPMRDSERNGSGNYTDTSALTSTLHPLRFVRGEVIPLLAVNLDNEIEIRTTRKLRSPEFYERTDTHIKSWGRCPIVNASAYGSGGRNNTDADRCHLC